MSGSSRFLAPAAFVATFALVGASAAQTPTPPTPAADAPAPGARTRAAGPTGPDGAPVSFSARMAQMTKVPEFTNSIGMVFEPIPEGAFVMGRYSTFCPDENGKKAHPVGAPANWTSADFARCKAMAKPSHRKGFVAELPSAYMMGKYEVTQAQFEKVMGYNPSYFKAGMGPSDASKRPVDSVSWKEAQTFVAKLNALEHTNVYRLPTEAEWEWAASAGVAQTGAWGRFHFENDGFGWFQGTTDTTQEAGGKKPNAWGLYDTLGNVWEWVADVYNDRLLPDPVSVKAGATHVLKGGSFMRDTNRTTPQDHAGGPGNKIDVGFRVMRSAE